MCQAFSCLITSDRKVTWKFGVDSHSELVKLAGFKDQTADPKQMMFARVEVTPASHLVVGSYFCGLCDCRDLEA